MLFFSKGSPQSKAASPKKGDIEFLDAAFILFLLNEINQSHCYDLMNH